MDEPLVFMHRASWDWKAWTSLCFYLLLFFYHPSCTSNKTEKPREYLLSKSP